MYGMVNNAILQFAENKHGAGAREQLCAVAGVDHEFVSMDQYPDSASVDLVVKLSEVSGLPAGEVLEKVGEYWIEYAAESTYGGFFDMAGDSFSEVLENLNDLHVQVGTAFDELTPPSFETEDETDSSVVLVYRSTRAGLTPMVKGLIRGLGRKYNTAVSVSEIDAGDASARFKIDYK